MGYKPRIRFKGFTEDWEQRKLIYIFNDFIVPMRDKPKIFSGTTPWTRIEDIEGRYINTSLSGQFVSDETIKSMNLKVIPKGSLIVSASATFGVVAIVNNDLITNQTFIGLVPNNDFDIDFLYSLFEAPTTKDKLLKLSAGSTIFYIARESFENLVLSVPSKAEQIKISKIFKFIDNSITLHQCKLEKLKLTKKALLQKLFPKNGKHIPEIRFKGFTDAWEQCKLSDVADVRDGTHDSPKFYNDGFPLVTSKNLKGGSIDFSDCSFISEQDFNEINKRSKVDPGDILFGMIGTIGNPAIVEHTGFAIKNVALIKEGNIINNRFIYHLLSSEVFENYIARENAGGTQKFIALNQIRNFDFLAPALVEQNKIIELLDCISQNITLHQRKLERLQEVKKGLLQKMFV